MEYYGFFLGNMGGGVIHFENMFHSGHSGGLLLVILLQEEVHNFYYVWNHCNHEFTISLEV